MNLPLYSRPFSSYGRKPLNSSAKLSGKLTERPQSSRLDLNSPLSDTLRTQRSLKNDALAEVFYTSPDSSQYNIELFFPSRPKTSTLSGLTLQENERTLFASLSFRGQPKFMAIEKEKTDERSMPNEGDFAKIITKLDMVCANLTGGNRRLMLNDGDCEGVMLEVGQVQFVSVNSKGKKPPMVASIKRSKGKVVCYLSKTQSEPGLGACDTICKNDCFQVGDVNTKFKLDAIFVAVEAITDCAFTISVSFGKKMTVKTTKALKILQEEQEYINRLDRKDMPFFTKRKKKVYDKDFVQKNIQKINEHKDISSRVAVWELKRSNAVIKKKSIIMEKKNRILNDILRRTQKIEVQKKEKSEIFSYPDLKKTQTLWLRLFFFLVTLPRLRRIPQQNTKKKVVRFKIADNLSL
jgi:hypothetical protein